MKPETTYPAIIGRILAQERKNLGIDQAMMAKKVGINRSSWSRLENGEMAPNAVLLDKIARALKKPPSDILAKADKARKSLEDAGVVVHSEKPKSKSFGVGLALLSATALGALIVNKLSKGK